MPIAARREVLKESETAVLEGEVVDATVMFMRNKALREFFEREMQDCRQAEDLLLSLHVKATMMKVSDPIIFGHAVKVYLQGSVRKHGGPLTSWASMSTTAWVTCMQRLPTCRTDQRQRSKPILQACLGNSSRAWPW